LSAVLNQYKELFIAVSGAQIEIIALRRYTDVRLGVQRGLDYPVDGILIIIPAAGVLFVFAIYIGYIHIVYLHTGLHGIQPYGAGKRFRYAAGFSAGIHFKQVNAVFQRILRWFVRIVIGPSSGTVGSERAVIFLAPQ